MANVNQSESMARSLVLARQEIESQSGIIADYHGRVAKMEAADKEQRQRIAELEQQLAARATARSADMVEWPRCKAADESRKMRCERPEGHEGHHYLVTAQEWRAIFPLE